MTTDGLAPVALRSAFSTFPSGVVSVCGMDETDSPVGMVVSTFVPVSLEPPLVAVCMQKTSRTWPALRQLPFLGISVLADGHRRAARQLAAREGDRFAGLETTVSGNGAVHLAGAPTSFECSIEHEFDAGDHFLVTLRIHSVLSDLDAQPLLFHRSDFAGIAAAPMDLVLDPIAGSGSRAGGG